MQAKGTIDDETAAILVKDFGADYAKSLKLDQNQRDLAEELAALENSLSGNSI